MKDRFLPSKNPLFECCLPPFSFYQFIEKFCKGQTNERTLHRIFSLMRKMNAKTVVTEELKLEGELEVEINAITKKIGKEPQCVNLWRFSFFTRPVTKEFLPFLSNENYLGYAIFISAKVDETSFKNYIYEAVIAEPAFNNVSETQFAKKTLPAHYVHCVRKYSAWVSDIRFTVSGSFFSQQNGLTNVCAHAALRWLLNNLPERAESIVSYEEINETLGIDHIKKDIGNGLSIDRCIDVIQKRNYKYILANFEDKAEEQPSYAKFIYSIIESGYPVLVFFASKDTRHVVCAIGHTFNSDIWDTEAKLAYSGAPKAKYISSSSWADHFIIHDDNYGMYFCMPTKSFEVTGSEPFRVTGALGIVPTVVELKPLEAELYSSIILKKFTTLKDVATNYWLDVLKKEDSAARKWIVLRTFLSSKTDYEKHLQIMEDPSGNFLREGERHSILKDLPDHFWITEFSLTDVFTANKHKLGEVLYRANMPDVVISPETEVGRAFSGCLAARLPGNIIIPKITSKDEITITLKKTNLIGHSPLMRMCRNEPFLEW